jgi:hypothetical protein
LKWKELFFSLCARRGHQSLTAFGAKTLNYNTVSVKSARAMWKVLMVQSCDNDILEGLAIANPFKPKIHCFLVGGIGGYSFYFLLNLQLK